MALKFFIIPVRQRDEEESLNQFIRSHSVLAVEKHWVECEANSYWSICVDYLDTPLPTKSPAGKSSEKREKVDYRLILNPDEFAV